MYFEEKRPDFTDDLSNVNNFIREITVTGNTKNLDLLYKFIHIEKLWVINVNQLQFDLILNQVNPRFLSIYYMRVPDLSVLEKLNNLEELKLQSNTKPESLWDISKNHKLKVLYIEDFKRLVDFSNLESCCNLEALSICGPTFSGPPIKLEDVSFLKKLNGLVYLEFCCVKLKNESLLPISFLENLKELRISNYFPTEEYARLSVLLPNTECSQFKSYTFVSQLYDGKDVMLTGKRKPFLNSKEDWQKIEKYDQQFKEFQSKYRE